MDDLRFWSDLTLRLAATFLLLFLFFASPLYAVSGGGEFTGGIPAGAELDAKWSVVLLDEVGEIEIGHATSFIEWMDARETGADEIVEKGGETPTSALDWVRGLLVACGVGAFASLAHIPVWYRYKVPKLFISFWLAGILLVVLGLPGAIWLDQHEQLADGQLPVEEPVPPREEFLHLAVTSDLRPHWAGLAVEFNASGYDRALIDEQNRTAAEKQPPGEEHRAWVAFAGSVTAGPTRYFLWWLLLPLVVIDRLFSGPRGLGEATDASEAVRRRIL